MGRKFNLFLTKMGDEQPYLAQVWEGPYGERGIDVKVVAPVTDTGASSWPREGGCHEAVHVR